jgi:hypothetical protein
MNNLKEKIQNFFKKIKENQYTKIKINSKEKIAFLEQLSSLVNS